MLSRRLLGKLLPFWTALLFLGSFLPEESKRAIGTQSGYSGPRWGHRIWHVGSFCVTGVLVVLVHTRRARWLVALFGLGLTIEILQVLLYGIQFEWWDVRDDGLGVMAAALAAEAPWLHRLIREDE